MKQPGGDLSVTALYTSQVWRWGELSCAPLLETTDAKRVFDITNAALGLSGIFRPRQTPLRQELLHRHTMIDYLLRESGIKHVLEIASGLSRRGAAFSADPHYFYTEVDLPAMVKKKRDLLARTEAGRAVLERPGLRLVGANVEHEPLTRWVSPNLPLFVIAEGLMMYLAAAAQRRLWAQLRALVDLVGSLRLVFDLTPTTEQPQPGVTGRALAAAMKRFTGGRGFEADARNRADLRSELLATGFDEVTIRDSAAVAHAWRLPHPTAQTHQVLFDCVVHAP